MADHKKFKIKDAEDFHNQASELGLSFGYDDDTSILGTPLTFGAHTAPNRFLVQPMEGFDSSPEGTPGELCFRRYRRYAEGGSGFIWFEATAILHEARSNPAQLWLHEGNAEVYKRLVSETKAIAKEKFGHDIIMVIQLTHSGRYSKPDGTPAPLIAHRSPILDPKHKLPENYPVISDEYLDELQNHYVTAAKLAVDAGFDGLDVKACHRYLVSELLASHTREGKYGGSYENRTRFIKETMKKLMDACPKAFVTTRLNCFDAISYPYGWGVSKDDYNTPDLTEPKKLINELKELGVPILNMSIGNPYFNPHYGRPYDKPIIGMDPPKENPLEGVHRFMGITREIQDSCPELPVIASGITWLRQYMPQVMADFLKTGGAAMVGQGRGAFAYPDSPKDIMETGAMVKKKVCITCSMCTQIMRSADKTGCVVRDTDVYKESMQRAKAAAEAEFA